MKGINFITYIIICYFFTSCSVHKGKTPAILYVNKMPKIQDTMFVYSPVVITYNESLQNMPRYLAGAINTESNKISLTEVYHKAMQVVLKDFSTIQVNLNDSIKIWAENKLEYLLDNKVSILKNKSNLQNDVKKKTYNLFSIIKIGYYENSHKSGRSSLIFPSKSYTTKKTDVHLFLFLIDNHTNEVVFYRNSLLNYDRSAYSENEISKQLLGSISRGFFIASKKNK